MTSSLRNSIHRRNHKERSQLSHRAKLGLLEKHADYVKRARDYHSKQDRLNRLKQKAAERNKDEFYFSMTKERTREGVHVQGRGNAPLPTDIVKVLKTQDENYVRTMRAAGLKKIDKIKNQLMEMADLLKSDLQSLGDEGLDENELKVLQDAKIFKSDVAGLGKKRNHFVFAESSEEASRLAKRENIEQTADGAVASPSERSLEVDLGWKSTENKKTSRRKSSSSHIKLINEEAEPPEDSKNFGTEKRRRLLKELSARLERDRQLRYAEREFEMQRQMMGKGGRKKIQGVEKVEGEEDEDEDELMHVTEKGDQLKPRVYKWRLERKR
ncbi:small-subunit processome [Gymnopilus junonius]|uniref:Small-subunit processome n=1 Tax=Gymnopilus junonius TaxID=109634 RepID=A0A9P5P2E5_GYMJU|nr:small-subunit processome [Gymnopilus junonius]